MNSSNNLAQLRKEDDGVPTARLQFVERKIDDVGTTRRVLQQFWVVSGSTGEWRDVPLVKD